MERFKEIDYAIAPRGRLFESSRVLQLRLLPPFLRHALSLLRLSWQAEFQPGGSEHFVFVAMPFSV
jgi:hypothetical protein